jgi:hypothetical protein
MKSIHVLAAKLARLIPSMQADNIINNEQVILNMIQESDPTSECKFKVGDLVSKPKGYTYDGTVVSVFRNLAGEIRVVAELTTGNGLGMLHIFSENQLERRSK